MRVDHLAIKSLRKKDYDFEPTTIGEHIKKKRLQLGLTQKAVAASLKVSEFSVLNWEIGDHKPTNPGVLRCINEFLGYDPIIRGTTIPDRLQARRLALGWSQKALAVHLGVQPDTVAAWEKGGRILKHRHRSLIEKFLGLPERDSQYSDCVDAVAYAQRAR